MRALWGLDRTWVGTKEQPGLTGRGIKSQPFSHLCAKPHWKNGVESGGETTDRFCSVSMAELTPQAPGSSGRDLRCSQASLTEPLTEAAPLPLCSLLCCSQQDPPHTGPPSHRTPLTQDTPHTGYPSHRALSISVLPKGVRAVRRGQAQGTHRGGSLHSGHSGLPERWPGAREDEGTRAQRSTQPPLAGGQFFVAFEGRFGVLLSPSQRPVGR